MRGARTAGGLAALLALVSLGAVRCAYSPDFPSGTLKCSTAHSCPDGYDCDTPSNLCYKAGELPSGAAGIGGKAGASGAAGMAGAAGTTGAGGMAGAGGGTGTAGAGGMGPPCAGTCTIKIDGVLTNADAPAPGTSADDKFLGHWVFQTGSDETVTCSDGSVKTNDLATDYVDITLPSNVLTGSYFCDWSLNVGPAGNLTIIKVGQSCSRNVTDAKTGVTKFTWHGTTFTFKTADSMSGTLAATVGVDYVDDPLKTGCSL